MAYFNTAISPEALINGQHRLLSLTGAGGKTSLSEWIGSLFLAGGMRVVITTTTKILPPKKGHIVLQDDGPDFAGRVHQTLNLHSKVTIAKNCNQDTGKLTGLDRSTISELYHSKVADTIIVEADGAARKSLKAPAEHEPVIPIETDLCIGIMGIDTVYRTLSESCVHRSTIFSSLTGAASGGTITPHHLIALAKSPHGLFKNCPARCSKIALLNKTDTAGGPQIISEFNNLLDSETTSDIQWIAGSVRTGQFVTLPICQPQITYPSEMQTIHSHQIQTGEAQ